MLRVKSRYSWLLPAFKLWFAEVASKFCRDLSHEELICYVKETKSYPVANGDCWKIFKVDENGQITFELCHFGHCRGKI